MNMSQFDQRDMGIGRGSAIPFDRSSWEQENISSPEMNTSYESDERRNQNGVGMGYLICLTLVTGGLQIVWTAIMGQGSPYLLSLGLPPYIISFIWLAGPISGTVIQPYISILSDRSQHPWGRRKHYIFFGTIFTIACMLLLPWTGDIVSGVFCRIGGDYESKSALIIRGAIASVLIWGLNISVQPVQMGVRALIVDACPLDQQIQATSYASCMTGIGTVSGYALRFVELPQLLPWLGDTQFKCLSFIACFALSLTVAVTLCTIKEKKILLDDILITREIGIVSVSKELLRNARLMSGRIKMVCKAQFFSWMGWFPFLFYISTYLGGLYEKVLLERSAESWSTAYISCLHDNAIREGALAMVLFAVVALLGNLILPLLVSSSNRKPPAFPELCKMSNHFNGVQNEENEGLLTKAPTKERLRTSIQPSRLSRLRTCLPLPGFTLPRAWAASQVLACVTLLSTSFSGSPIFSTFLISLLGISWASTQWAPLALVSTSIARQRFRQSISSQDPIYVQTNNSDLRLEVQDSRDVYSTDDERENEKEDGLLVTAGELQVGAVMGVYNAAIAAPQIISAVWSGGMFWVLSKWGLDNSEALGWVIRIASLTGLVSAWFAFKIDVDDEDDEN